MMRQPFKVGKRSKAKKSIFYEKPVKLENNCNNDNNRMEEIRRDRVQTGREKNLSEKKNQNRIRHI